MDPTDPTPLPADPGDSFSWILQQRKAAQAAAITSLDDNPDDAARAQELSKATGVDPSLVYGDLEGFQQQHKAAITSSLLTNNEYLRNYANSHPLTAKVSTDDWGQLDKLTQSIEKFMGSRAGQIIGAPATAGEAFAKKFAEAFQGPPGSAFMDTPKDLEQAQAHPGWGAVAAGASLVGLVPETILFRTIGGAFGGASEGAKVFYKQLTGQDPPEMMQNILDAAGDPGLMASLGLPEMEQAGKTAKIQAQLREEATKAAPYLKAGVQPPIGTSELWDEAHKEQAKLDMKNLDEVVKDAGASRTYERGFGTEFGNATPLKDVTIGIQAEAVRKLYGDKQPEAGDGLLGDLPGMAKQLQLAELHGGDVEVPLKEWIDPKKVDPEIHKELHDNIRVRPGGMTLEEAKEPVTHAAEPREEEEYRPYKNVPDSLMGFRKEGPQRGFQNENYKFEQPVRVGLEGQEPFEDTIKGLNKEHALERARRNWPEAKIEAITDPAVDTVRQASALHDSLTADEEEGIIPKEVGRGQIELPSGEMREAQSFLARDAIQQIDTSQLTGVPKVLRDFFGDKLDQMAGDTPVWTVDEETMRHINKSIGIREDAPAFYHHEWHAIVMERPAAGGEYGRDYAAHIMYHELAHAATSREIEANPELKAAVRRMMDESNSWLQANDANARKTHNYAFTDEHEFVAEAFSNPRFQNVLATTPISKALAASLELDKGKSVWDAVRSIVKSVIGRLLGVKDVPDSILDGVLRLGPTFEEAGRRLKEGKGQAHGAEPLDRDLFKRLMPKDQLERYSQLIEKKQAEDIEFSKGQAEKLARQEQTKEWKENLPATREDVKNDLVNRPDLAADRFLRLGELYGEKTKKVKLDLKGEDAKGLPPDYVGTGGVHPDDMAGLFGYQSGSQLVTALKHLEQERQMEGLTPQWHFSRLVDAETDREMRKRFGDPEKNVLEAAKDHVISPTQMDILHEQTLALGMKTKGENFKYNKDTIRNAAKQVFDTTPGLAGHTADKYLAAAGRAGRKVEEHLLEEKYADAFKEKQNQYISLLYANEAKKLEKLRDQFDTKVKSSWTKRDIPGVDQKDAVWIHHILIQIGQGVRRSIQDLERSKVLVSAPKSLRDYVEGANQKYGIYDQDPDAMTVGQSVNVEPLLFSDNYRTPVDQMSPEEFRNVFNSLKSIDNYGRNDKKYTVKGDKRQLEDVVSGLIERLKAAVNNRPAATEAHKQSAQRLVGSWILNPETWFNRLDLANRQGPFNQLIVRPITEGQYTLRTSERDFAARWRALGEWKDANKKIENTLFRDKDGDLLQMTRKNALAVLANMGNKLQREKLAKGWGIEGGEQVIWNWLQRVGITQEDLAKAQKMGDIFSNAFSLSEKAYTHTAGVAPARIDLGTMQTPWGEAKEWYHPLIPDPLRHSSKMTADDMIGESGYWRPSPASGYTKTRTKAAYPIDLSFDSVPFKLKQILNDAAMRIPITEVSKILYHRDFQTAFKKYYGPEYASALDAWMKDAAGNRQWVPANLKALDMAASGIQRNLSTLQIGMNLGTVAKHAPTAAVFSAWEVGLGRFAKSLAHMTYELPGSKERWKFAMDSSEELQNRLRHVEDTIIGQSQDLFSTKTGVRKGLENFKNAVEYYGHYPVGMTDLLSAVSMWDAEYRRLMEDPDMSHGDAVYGANTAVRRTHGSSILTNRPGISRYNSPFVKLIMPYYNFFNNALQRNYELAWKAKLALSGRELPEMTGFEKEQFKAGPQHIAPLIGALMVFGVMPSLIEQMVDPLPTDPRESKVKHWAKVLTRAYPSMIPVVRDIVNALYGGHDPALGLYGTFARNVEQSIDPKSYTGDPGKAFHTANQVFGTLSGMTVEPVGKAGKFIINTLDGKEHPKGMGDLFKGIRAGTLKEPRR